MNDPFSGRPAEGGKWRQRFMDLDSWVDSSLHEAGHGLVEYYERLCNFMLQGRGRLAQFLGVRLGGFSLGDGEAALRRGHVASSDAGRTFALTRVG